jgi:hypothetical protein
MTNSQPFDFAKQGYKNVERDLNISLKLFGLLADVTTLSAFPNAYAVYPELEELAEPDERRPKETYQIKVLVGQPVKGLNINTEFISLSDKVEEFMNLTTTAKLEVEQEVLVYFPDRKLKFRIIAPGLSLHAYSTQAFVYEACVM